MHKYWDSVRSSMLAVSNRSEGITTTGSLHAAATHRDERHYRGPWREMLEQFQGVGAHLDVLIAATLPLALCSRVPFCTAAVLLSLVALGLQLKIEGSEFKA